MTTVFAFKKDLLTIYNSRPLFRVTGVIFFLVYGFVICVPIFGTFFIGLA